MAKLLFNKSLFSGLVACCVIVYFLSGCVVPEPAQDVKKAESLTPKEIPTGEKAKAVEFKRVVVKIPRGTEIGTIQRGWACTPTNQPIIWRGGRVDVNPYELDEVFREEFESNKYKVVGDPDELFGDQSSWEAEFLIGALITDVNSNLCYEYMYKAKGEMYMNVDWQVYSRLDRKVVYRTTTDGSFTIGEARRGAFGDLFVYAFGEATRNLLADQKFYALLTQEEKTDYTKAQFEKIFMIQRTPFKDQIENSIDVARRGVVTVFAGDGHGSGFFIDASGYVLTADHVVGAAKNVKIKLADGRELSGRILRKDSRMDIALVKVDEENMVTLPINEEELKIGTSVFAIGSPLDEKLDSTLTKGVVSAYRSEKGIKVIQSDVSILPGNSGGPLIDQKGNVVGIAASAVFFGTVPVGLNFFIPINGALAALNIGMVSSRAEAIEAAKKERETRKASDAEEKKTEKEIELSYWESIKDSKEISTFEDYLRKYPDGTFSDVARIKIDELSRLKLAVFPWDVNLKRASHYAYDKSEAKNRAIDALKKALNSHDTFIPTHSYYKLGKEFKTKLISLSIIPNGDINELWRKKSSLAHRSLNIDLVCKLGKHLKVDIVLLYSIVVLRERYSTNIYFVDVNTKKVFTRADEFGYQTYSDEIKKFTQKSFVEFEKQLPQKIKRKRAKANKAAID